MIKQSDILELIDSEIAHFQHCETIEKEHLCNFPPTGSHVVASMFAASSWALLQLRLQIEQLEDASDPDSDGRWNLRYENMKKGQA